MPTSDFLYLELCRGPVISEIIQFRSDYSNEIDYGDRMWTRAMMKVQAIHHQVVSQSVSRLMVVIYQIDYPFVDQQSVLSTPAVESKSEFSVSRPRLALLVGHVTSFSSPKRRTLKIDFVTKNASLIKLMYYLLPATATPSQSARFRSFALSVGW